MSAIARTEDGPRRRARVDARRGGRRSDRTVRPVARHVRLSGTVGAFGPAADAGAAWAERSLRPGGGVLAATAVPPRLQRKYSQECGCVFKRLPTPRLRRRPLAGARNRLCRQDWGECQGLAFEQSPYFRADVPQDCSDCEGDSCRHSKRRDYRERDPDQGRHAGGRIGKRARFLKPF